VCAGTRPDLRLPNLIDIARDLTPPILWRAMRQLRDKATERRDLEAAAAYEIAVAKTYVAHLKSLGIDTSGAEVLEIGPGSTPGAALILASNGARVTVTDRFMCKWEERRHPRILRSILSLWAAPLPAVSASLSERAFAIAQIAAPAEDLPIADNRFDAVISNAVLEHVEDIRAVCKELFRVTKIGGVHSHQVDFRDHRHFSTPLEPLITELPPGPNYKDEYGTLLRCSELERIFQEAGFGVKTDINMLADESYFSDFLPRLRTSRSPYRDWPEQDLRILGAKFSLRKNGSG
jgi:SAM-dependent methyltransferase